MQIQNYFLQVTSYFNYPVCAADNIGNGAGCALYMPVCVHTHVCVCACVFVYMPYTYMPVCAHTSVCLHMCICIHVSCKGEDFGDPVKQRFGSESLGIYGHLCKQGLTTENIDP